MEANIPHSTLASTSTLSTPFSQLNRTPNTPSSLGHTPPTVRSQFKKNKRKIFDPFSPTENTLLEDIDMENPPKTPSTDKKKQYFR